MSQQARQAAGMHGQKIRSNKEENGKRQAHRLKRKVLGQQRLQHLK